MPAPVNPYVCGNAVGASDAFVGREDVLKAVKDVLRHPQENTIVLYGQRRIGKTSVLRELEAKLPTEGNYLTVFFDLQGKGSLPLEQMLQELADKICSELKRETQNLLDLLQKWDNSQCLVLLFDEFEAIAGIGQEEEKAGAAFFPFWREHLMPRVDTRSINFVFTIGRNVEDLSTHALSVFKAVSSKRVSLLDRENTIKLVRLSEKNETLYWSDEAIEAIWEQTQGHPYLTQHLCSCIWNNLHDDSQKKIPPVTVSKKEVDQSIPIVLERTVTALEWLWDGLPATEKWIASLLAPHADWKTEADLEHILQKNGISLIRQDTRRAIDILVEWDLLERNNDHQFRFRVKLFRRWVAENKYIRKVQEELDSSEVHANNFYESAKTARLLNRLDSSIDDLNMAVQLNPRHVGAHELLATLLRQQNRMEEARQVLEVLYLLRPNLAQDSLIQTLVSLADGTLDEEQKLEYYQRVLEISPAHQNAQEKSKPIWLRKAQKAEKIGELEVAIHAYKKAGENNKADEIKIQMVGGKEIEAFLTQLVAAHPAVELIFLYHPQYNLLLCSNGKSEITKQTLRKRLFSPEPAKKSLQYLQGTIEGFWHSSLIQTIFSFTNSSVLVVNSVDINGARFIVGTIGNSMGIVKPIVKKVEKELHNFPLLNNLA